MIDSQHQRSKGFLYLSCVILFLGSAIALRLIFFWISVTHVPASPDESTAALVAKRIREGHFQLLIFGAPYQFPLESYLSAPFLKLLRPNALSARLELLIMGFLTALFHLMIFRKMGSLKKTWPGCILVLAPSAYFLTLQCAYAPPQYSVIAWLTGLVLLSGISLQGRLKYFKIGIIGLLGGLAISSSILVLSVIAPVSVWICFGVNWKDLLKRTPIYLTGLFFGLIPYLLARQYHPGAYNAVTEIRSLTKAFEMIHQVLTQALPGAMGIAPPLFPDNEGRLMFLSKCASVIFSILYLLIFSFAAILRIARGYRRILSFKWPILEISDVFLSASFFCFFLFFINTRSHPGTYRYLLPMVWFFPFLLNDLYMNSRKYWQYILGVLALSLTGINLANSGILIHTWTRPDFAKIEAGVPDIKPLIDYLKQKQIRYVYAPFGISYRIPYETDEAILCSQPYNERFLGWPLPYKDRVDQARNVAFAFSDFACKGLRWEKFEEFLRELNIEYRKVLWCGFKLYFDFRADSVKIPHDHLTVSASHNDQTTHFMADGSRYTLWKSRSSQKAGMWIELRLLREMRINQIELFYDADNHQRARSLNIFIRDGGVWKKVISDEKDKLNSMIFENGHPVFINDFVQVYRFHPALADAVKIDIAEPNAKRNWCVSEIEIFRKVSGRHPKGHPELPSQ